MTTRLQHPTLRGPAGALEAALHEREGRPHGLVALVLHPHPVYGGTLHNKVVHRAASTLHELGAEVLRINFRGVGASEGAFDEGDGELEDARAALGWLRQRYPGARLWLAGFSFGSWIAARLTAVETDLERVILIAPPVTRMGFERLETAHTPKLVIQGMADTVCPPADLERVYPRWAEPKQLVWVPEASHFFDRQLSALGDALARTLSPVVTGTAA
jgi:alpha/beta superfamily hydrolase